MIPRGNKIVLVINKEIKANEMQLKMKKDERKNDVYRILAFGKRIYKTVISEIAYFLCLATYNCVVKHDTDLVYCYVRIITLLHQLYLM